MQLGARYLLHLKYPHLPIQLTVREYDEDEFEGREEEGDKGNFDGENPFFDGFDGWDGFDGNDDNVSQFSQVTQEERNFASQGSVKKAND